MSTAFDLEKAIAAWRRPFEHNRAFSGEDLDELEAGLRDRVDALVKAGRSKEAAFEEARQRIGSHRAAETEYRKVYWGKLLRQRRLMDELRTRSSMLANYLKIVFRNLLRHKGYSFINLAGLTLGLSCCLLIFQYVAFEYSFDDFNEHADDLYRVIRTQAQNEGTPSTSPRTGWAMAPAVAEEVPEIARIARLHPEYNNAIVSNPASPGDVFEEEAVYYADPAFLQMFSYPLLEGEPGRVLSEPGTIALSEAAARKYFGSTNPIGQTLDVAGWITGSFRVAGVFEDVPANSHLQFDLLLPMDDLLERSQFSDPTTGWGWNNFNTYVQLRDNAVRSLVEQKLTDVLARHREEYFRESNITASVEVQPLRDIHLNGDITATEVVMGSYRTVTFFTLIGLITLLIALVNHVNLATARAMDRAREVGVRKAVGAQRMQLVTQFLSEVALTNALALALAVILALALRPVVNQLAGTSMTLAIWTSPVFWTTFLTTFCLATVLAGIYPSFVLSSFRPAVVLKGHDGSWASQAWLRRGLVVVQFAASIALLVGTTVVYRQLDFMQSMDLGIDLEQVLTVPAPRVLPDGTDRADVVEVLKQELQRLPAVRQVATSSSLPGQGFSFNTGNIRKVTADPSQEVPGGITWIDTNFVSLYGLELIAGEDLARVHLPVPEAEPDPILINETMMHAVGFGSPSETVGQPLYVGGDRRIVGVLEDFNWSSTHTARENAVFFLSRGESELSIKVSTANLPETLAAIDQLYKQRFPGDPFRYAFADEQFDRQYRNEQRFATLFGLFAALAICIACLGLFGLAAFTARKRTKEIGVRKVLGASVGGLVALLSKHFLGLVAVAFAIAAPVAYVVMDRWLQGFAYRIELSWPIFVLAGLTACGIALLTVSYHAINAALADPVKSLRYE